MTNRFSDRIERTTVPSEADRRAFVRDWIARRLSPGRIARTGLATTLLTLPALAAAQGTTEFVAVSGIEGVTGVQTMPDGSLQLTMSNGTTISVPAEDVRIGADGEILVSDRIADIAAEVMAGDAGGGGFDGTVLAAGLGGVAAAAAAGGGGGGGSGGGGTPQPDPELLNLADFQTEVLGETGGFNSENTGIALPEGTTAIEVTVTDGDGNPITSGEGQVDEDGNWTFDPGAEIPQGNVIVTVTSFDGDDTELDSTTLPFIIDTIPPVIAFDEDIAGDNILNIDEQDTGITVTGTTDAEAGQIVTVTIDGQDFTATVQPNGTWSVDLPDTALAGLSDASEVTITATVSDAAGNPSETAEASFDTDFTPPTINIDTPVAGDGVINLDEQGDGFLLSGTAPGANPGDVVTVLLDGTIIGTTTVQSAEFWSFSVGGANLSGLSDGDTPQFSARISDGAGNIGQTTAGATTDLQAPSIAITDLSAGAVMNIAESGEDLTVSGTATGADGQEVTVTIGTAEFTTTVTGGTWTVTAPNGELPHFADDSTVQVTADVSDAAGNPAPQASASFDTDFTPPTIAITDTGTGPDGVLNIAEQGSGITISGTTDAEDGQVVTVRLFDGPTAVPGGASGSTEYTTTATGGTWSVDIPHATLAQFSGDGSVRVTANVDDAAGNPATEAEETFDRDLTPPTLSIDTISGDDQIGLNDVQGDLEITGTTNAEIGQPVTLTFNGQDFTGAVISNSLGGAEPNAWSVTVPQAALQDVQDNAVDGLASVAVSATVADAAGNPAATPATATVSADFNGPSITIDPISGDNLINLAESGEDIIISGTVNNVADTQDVTLNVGTLGPLTVGISGGVWQTSLTPQQALDAGLTDGATLDITADVTDGDGVPAPQATAQITADFTAPVVFLDTIAESSNPGDDTDGLLNANALTNGIDLSGRATGAAGGTVEFFFGPGDPFPSTVAVDADGNWSLGFTGNVVNDEFPAGPGDRELDFIVIAVDEAGNRSDPVTRTITLDVTPPEVTIDSLESDGQPLGPVMNIAESGEDLVISGTVDGADAVTVTLNGTEVSGVSVNSGSWTVTVPSATLQGLGADANVEIVATAADTAGNTGTSGPENFTTDFTAPTVAITTPIAGDDVVNIAEQGQPLDISGTATGAEGQTVTVTLSGGGSPLTATGTVSGGAWTVSFSPTQLADLTGWPTVNVDAEVDDAAGNTGNAPQVSIATDFTAPTIAITTPIAEDDVVNLAERDGGISISGTSDAIGQQVTVTFNGTALAPVTVDGSGDWTVDVPSDRLTGLSTVNPTDITAEVADAAGNTASDSASITADFSAPTIVITGLSAGAVMNAAEQGLDLVINGTASGTNSGTVTVTFNGSDLAPVPVSSGTWTATVPAADLAGLTDGQTIEITASGSDPAGNTGTSDPVSFTTDFTPPTIAITDTGVGPDDILNIAERDAGIAVSGTATGAEGQTVTVTLAGVEGAPIIGTGTVSGGEFSVGFDATALAGIGAWAAATVTAEVSDAAGNPATPATDGFDIDLVAPTIAFDDPPPNGFVIDLAQRESADGIDFTTSETVGDVTLTFTRTDGSGTVEFTATEALADIPQDGGVFIFPLTPADIGGLSDETEFTVAITITDAAGNEGTPDTFTVETDFAPILTIDEIGVDGAVDLSDTEDAAITGTTLGVEQGNTVDVTVTGSVSGQVLIGNATVGADGTWSLAVPPAFFAALEPGETFTVAATVDNDAGRTATDQQAGIEAFLPSLFAFANIAESGATLSISAIAGEGLDTDGGITTTMTFDPARATYVNGSDDDNLDLFIVNSANAATGTVIFSGGTLSGPLAEGDELYSFDITDQDNGPITLSFEDDTQGGPTELQIGTAGADALTASNTDSVIQAKGGDDSIDVSATGTNVVVFELDQASNGTDTVTGFTTGDTFQSDVIAFLGQADLRGDGDFVETLATGGALGANTGFVIFTTALGDTDAATLETAFEGLFGENTGDVVYFLAGDGEDAALARATVNAEDDASVEILATFTGIGDLTQMNVDNVILPDPATVPV